LRLPTGIFDANGVEANVLFFDNRVACKAPWTSQVWFWLKDKSLADLDNLPEPDELAEETIENIEAGLGSFREVLAGLAQA
jgi:type I restriction-modification system DNA methylase subunit